MFRRVLVGLGVVVVAGFAFLQLGGPEAVRRWDANRRFGGLAPLAHSFVESVLTGDTAWLRENARFDHELERTLQFASFQPTYFEQVRESMRLAFGIEEDSVTWLFFDIDAHGACPDPEWDSRTLEVKLTDRTEDGRWIVLRASPGPC